MQFEKDIYELYRTYKDKKMTGEDWAHFLEDIGQIGTKGDSETRKLVIQVVELLEEEQKNDI